MILKQHLNLFVSSNVFGLSTIVKWFFNQYYVLFAVFLFMVDVKFHIRNGRTAGGGGGEEVMTSQRSKREVAVDGKEIHDGGCARR